MAWISSYQKWLSETESLQNAQMVANHFAGTDWTKNAISAMLGNMRHESSINPDMYEYGYDWGSNRGYGLVQWTPRSKYWDWATSKGLSPRNGDSQLARIDYEVDQNIQWIATSNYPLSFADFRKSTQSVEYLTQAFTWCYERPNASAGQTSMPERIAFANRAFNELDWTGTGGGNSGGLQLAQFPMDMIHITQGENGSWSHMGILAIDFVGTHAKYPYYAPCDCECIRASNDIAVWKSDKEVMCADGQVRKIFWDVIHEVPLSHGVGTKLKKGQLMGHTGVGGTATGDHLHLQVMNGWDYQGFGTSPQGASTLVGEELHIFDVFAVNGVNIVQGLGYPWKTSDYVDGSEGGNEGGGSNGKNNNLILLYLTGALKWG